jgi:hypothetical protein
MFTVKVQLHKTTESYEKLERQLKGKEDEAKKREDELRDLLSKVSKTVLPASQTNFPPNYLVVGR